MTEKLIQAALNRQFIDCDYLLFNAFVYGWESDFYCLTKSKLSIEVEVKCSRADFKKDFTKKDKHDIFTNHKKTVMAKCMLDARMLYDKDARYTDENGRTVYAHGSYVSFLEPHKMLPNRFFYCVPENLIAVTEVPAYAGLIYVSPAGVCRIMKAAPLLHKEKWSDNLKYTLLTKFHWKTKNLKTAIYDFIYQVERTLTAADLEKIKDSITRLKNNIFDSQEKTT